MLGHGLAAFFAVCTVFAAIGAGGMFQSNQAAMSFLVGFEIPKEVTGLILAVLTGMVILGGVKRISAVAGWLVPSMAVSYVLACLSVILLNIDMIPDAIGQIVRGALYGTAAVGGFTGVAFRMVLMQGIRRAAFSNEAGFGSAAIAHSAVRTKEPVREGVVAILGPFIDTIVVCSMTALAIIITGVWQTTDPNLRGVVLTQAALDSSIPGLGAYFVPIAVGLFAFSTMISWSYYGGRAVDYLFGREWAISMYKIFYCVFIFVGAMWELKPVLNFTDSAVALMIFPNMLALLMMWRVVLRENHLYFRKLKEEHFPVFGLEKFSPKNTLLKIPPGHQGNETT